jgi:voltage-gated potassium channel
MKTTSPSTSVLRRRLYEIIFEADTPAGKAFDVVLILAILSSVSISVLDSVASIRAEIEPLLTVCEWAFTALFAIEYGLRLYCSPRPSGYARSFFGVIDLIGWLPTVIALSIPGAHYLTTFRMIRVLRIFRVLKMVAYIKEAQVLGSALNNSRRKIMVFLFAVVTLVILLGSLMYMIEGPENGYTSIPVSVYWAIVTLTTVGYGDISPQTPVGQLLASVIMILGYAIIAVPTGIVSAEFIKSEPSGVCPHCGKSLTSSPDKGKEEL